jgi:hypothetical protein
MDEKKSRDRALLGALHPGVIEDLVEVRDTPDFDAGVRIDPQAERGPQPQSYPTTEPDGWRETEIEDGAALLFPWITPSPAPRVRIFRSTSEALEAAGLSE